MAYPSRHSTFKSTPYTGARMETLRQALVMAPDSKTFERVLYRALDEAYLQDKVSVGTESIGVYASLERRGPEKVHLWWNVVAPEVLGMLPRIHPVFERASGGKFNSSGSCSDAHVMGFLQNTQPFEEHGYDASVNSLRKELSEAKDPESWHRTWMNSLAQVYASYRGVDPDSPLVAVWKKQARELEEKILPIILKATILSAIDNAEGKYKFAKCTPYRGNLIELKEEEKMMLRACPVVKMNRAVNEQIESIEMDADLTVALANEIVDHCRAYHLLTGSRMPAYMVFEIFSKKVPSAHIDNIPQLEM